MIVHPANTAMGPAKSAAPQPFKLLLAVALFLAALTTTLFAQGQVTLAWNASTDTTVVGYRLYQGGASGSYTNSLDVGNAISATVSNVVAGGTYYFAVTAYNAYGLESPFSAEVSYTVPTATPPPSTPPAVALTVPAAGTSYTAPATVNLAASVTANGHTITQVQFYNGSTLLGSSSAAPFAYTWSAVSAGSYSLFARVVYDGGSTLDSTTAGITVTSPVTAPSLPAPWQTLDIGAVQATGSADVSNSVFTVTGAGTIGGSIDKFRFVYQALSGDGEIRAQILATENLNYDWAGVMIRESLTATSAYGLVGLASGDIVRFSARTSTGSNSKGNSDWTATPPNIWVRLVRSGNDLYGYKSTDGVNWSRPITHYSVPMAANIYIGLAVASGSASGLNTAMFGNLTVVP